MIGVAEVAHQDVKRVHGNRGRSIADKQCHGSRTRQNKRTEILGRNYHFIVCTRSQMTQMEAKRSSIASLEAQPKSKVANAKELGYRHRLV